MCIVSEKWIYRLTDANINLLLYESCKYAEDFLYILQSYSFMATIIDKPTRIQGNSVT